MNSRRCCIGVSALVLAAVSLGLSAPALAVPTPVADSATPAASAVAQADVALSSFRLIALERDSATVELRGTPGSRATVTNVATGTEYENGVLVTGRLSVKVPAPRGTSIDYRATVSDGTTTSPSLDLRVVNSVEKLDAPVVKSQTETGRGRFRLDVEAMKGAELTVRDSRGQVVGHTPIATSGDEPMVGVTWNTQDAPSARRFTVVQSYGVVSSEATPFRLGDVATPPPGHLNMPEIDGSSIENDQARILVSSPSAPAGAVVKLRDFFGKELAAQSLVGGRGELVISAPSSTERYLVSIAHVADSESYESNPIDVTLTVDGRPLVPEAPRVDGVVSAGSKTVATVAGIPGSTITVRDADDRIVAIKRIASSSSNAQIVLPSSAALSVTDATGAIESDPTAIPLP